MNNRKQRKNRVDIKQATQLYFRWLIEVSASTLCFHCDSYDINREMAANNKNKRCNVVICLPNSLKTHCTRKMTIHTCLDDNIIFTTLIIKLTCSYKVLPNVSVALISISISCKIRIHTRYYILEL